MPRSDSAEDDRRAELLGGAVSGDLDAAEQRELDALLAADPSAAAELEEQRATVELLLRHGSAQRPSAQLRDRVLLQLSEPAAHLSLAGSAPSPSVRPGMGSRWWAAAATVGVLLLGSGIAVGRLSAGGADAPSVVAVSGPPGTLGAREPLSVQAAAGVAIDAAVVAHTWGTEAVFDVAGLTAGQTYQVTFESADGRTLDAGSFLATTGTVRCRMNAALLRPDARQLSIVGPDGSAVVAATLPAVPS
ncbi:MAG TPA: hypothetical protein VFR07_19225 [Mycobacteriales bacterium]|nr:hypothetical protein [Mycobacteriales bacterium]